MSKNYYKILEVDSAASQEVIEKAYKTLAKKYHPDLQEANMKLEAEEKLKCINEAYEVLSNPDSRTKYDATLQQSTANYYSQPQEDTQAPNMKRQQEYGQQEELRRQQEYEQQEQELRRQQEYQRQLQYENELQQARQKAYHDAYIQDLKNRGYKIKYKKTPKEIFKNFVALLLTVLVLYLICQLPFVKQFFKDVYEDIPFVKSTIDTLTQKQPSDQL